MVGGGSFLHLWILACHLDHKSSIFTIATAFCMFLGGGGGGGGGGDSVEMGGGGCCA